MPLFEYQCKSCGRRFETLVLGPNRPAPPCPACESRDVEKQYSSFGVSSGGGRRAGSAPVSFGGG